MYREEVDIENSMLPSTTLEWLVFSVRKILISQHGLSMVFIQVLLRDHISDV